MAGPLRGVRVVEFAGMGPGPFCGMLFADLGAEVTRIDRLGVPAAPPADSQAGAAARGLEDAPRGPQGRFDVLARGKSAVALDLKSSAGHAGALDLIANADIVIEGYRPGVMERLNLGPDVCLARQPALVYGRVTGWGQTGPLAHKAGHDINYLALTGVLDAIGPAERPVPPLNLLADFGGGGMLLAVGALAALDHARRTGEGQVVDAAMFEGAALLAAMIFGLRAQGSWRDAREANLLDGGAPEYGVYACRDGRHLAIGPLEAPFFRAFLNTLGLDPSWAERRADPAQQPALKALIAETIAQRSRDAWTEAFRDVDACVTPVLSWDEALAHDHARARRAHVTVGGAPQPAPAPKFTRTPCAPPTAPPEAETAAAAATAGPEERAD